MSLCLKVIYGTFANKSAVVIYITPGPAQRSSKSKDDNSLILLLVLSRKFKRRTRVPHLVLQIRSKTPTLVVFRVKKRETGKVNITTKKESSSRTRDRPVEYLTRVSYLEKYEHCTCLRGLWLRRSFCHYLSSLRSRPQPKGSNLLVPCWSFHRDTWICPMG